VSLEFKNPRRVPGDQAQASPQDIVEKLFSDPPTVHIELGNPEGGVWRTDRDCYEFLANSCKAGMQTLETGLGMSTALFLMLGARHTCVTPFSSEISRLEDYCRRCGLSREHLTLIHGTSEEMLPTLRGELDLVFIDGCHAFPTPMIDWFYAGSRLRRGGILAIDDLHLPAAQVLVRYLDSDPRWAVRARTVKWTGFERLSEGPFRDEWFLQPFYKP
jgi:Methyltransferase domain